MTIICGLRTPSGVWIGSDSRIMMGERILDGVKKWVPIGDNLMASWAGYSLMERAFHGVGQVSPETVCDQMWAEMKKRWSMMAEAGEPKAVLGDGLIASRDGGLWRVSSELHLVEIPQGTFIACGSGAQYALGAWLGANRIVSGWVDEIKTAVDERYVISCAVMAASALDVHCGGEQFVEFLPKAQAPLAYLSPVPGYQFLDPDRDRDETHSAYHGDARHGGVLVPFIPEELF